MIVISSDDQPGAPPPGSEIIAVNGQPAPRILAATRDDSPGECWPTGFGSPDRWAVEWKHPADLRLTRSDLFPPTSAPGSDNHRSAAIPILIDWTSAATTHRTRKHADAAALGAALAGTWTGTLDYRDYGTDRRVILPTGLSVTGGRVPALTFTFDDGPGKTVRSRETWSLDVGRRVWCIAGDGPAHCHRIVEYRSGPGPTDVTLVAEGRGEENGRGVKLRLILARRGGTLSFSTQSAPDGQPLVMRHAYWLSVAPPT
ncbi:MAG: hypothetical protein PW843_23640 [Azospirillaceae bacterium]|nr:hypothetical protein [Azospirillaceae bacterium]